MMDVFILFMSSLVGLIVTKQKIFVLIINLEANLFRKKKRRNI